MTGIVPFKVTPNHIVPRGIRMEPVLISIRDVQAILGGISRTTLYRRIKDETLPGPVKIGRRSFWERTAILKAVEKILGNTEADQ